MFLRLNPLSRGPSDKLIAPAAATVQKFDEQFRRLTSDTAPIDDDQPGMGRLMKAFRLHNDVQPLLGRIRDAQKSRELPRGLEFEVVDEAVQRKVLTPREAVRVKEAEEAALAAIEVDVFTPENYFQTPVAAKE